MDESRWWVRIHVNGAVRIDGVYPDGTSRNDGAIISWVPSVGWQFDNPDVDSSSDDWESGHEESKWRGVTIRAHKDLDTPVTITHDVLDQQSECPPDLKGLGTVSVSSNPNPGSQPQSGSQPESQPQSKPQSESRPEQRRQSEQ